MGRSFPRIDRKNLLSIARRGGWKGKLGLEFVEGGRNEAESGGDWYNVADADRVESMGMTIEDDLWRKWMDRRSLTADGCAHFDIKGCIYMIATGPAKV